MYHALLGGWVGSCARSHAVTRSHTPPPTHAQLGPAAPVVSALASGGADREATVSELYGGQGGDSQGVDTLYRAVGQV